MDATLLQGLYACAAVAFGCWLLGVLTKEHSWVDRAWSLTPVAYAVFFAWKAGLENPRVARLTFNFARKGGYAKGGEDYRWPVMRKKMSPWQWQLFSFFFVAGYQNLLLFLLALPAWVAMRSQAPFGPLDAVATIGFGGFLVLETVADQQQWNFHQDKKARLARGESLESPFLTTGLFAYSRHPNFFAEQALWWSLYLFAVAATGQWLNISIIGPSLLTMLFHGSTNFTESITLSRYPEYAQYQKRTSRLIPWPPG